MTLITSAAGGLLPAEYGQLVSKPVEALSVAFLVGTKVNITAHDYRIPVLDTDVVTGAVVEAAEITPSDAVFTELVITPAKFAGLSIISNEMANDSDPSAADQVGMSIARQLANSMDKALFTDLAAPNPAGLAALTGISTVDAPEAFADLDPLEEAVSLSEAAGGRVTHWVTGAETALSIAKLKSATGSNQGLLNSDLTSEGRRSILGRPVVISPFVPAGTVYGISRDDFLVITREDTRLDIDRSAWFSSDRVGVRGVMRCGFAFPVPATQVRITNADAA